MGLKGRLRDIYYNIVWRVGRRLPNRQKTLLPPRSIPAPVDESRLLYDAQRAGISGVIINYCMPYFGSLYYTIERLKNRPIPDEKDFYIAVLYAYEFLKMYKTIVDYLSAVENWNPNNLQRIINNCNDQLSMLAGMFEYTKVALKDLGRAFNILYSNRRPPRPIAIAWSRLQNLLNQIISNQQYYDLYSRYGIVPLPENEITIVPYYIRSITKNVMRSILLLAALYAGCWLGKIIYGAMKGAYAALKGVFGLKSAAGIGSAGAAQAGYHKGLIGLLHNGYRALADFIAGLGPAGKLAVGRSPWYPY